MTKRKPKPDPRPVKLLDKVRFAYSPSRIPWKIVDIDERELKIDTGKKARYVTWRAIYNGKLIHMDGTEIFVPEGQR